MAEIPGVAGTYTKADVAVDKYGRIISASSHQHINDNLIATVTGTNFTGRVSASAGISGSLQNLANGTSYLVSTGSIAITTSSSGQVFLSTLPQFSSFMELWHAPLSGTSYDDEFRSFVPNNPWIFYDSFPNGVAGASEMTGNLTATGFDPVGLNPLQLTGNLGKEYRYVCQNSWLSLNVERSVGQEGNHSLYLYRPVTNFPTNCVIWSRFSQMITNNGNQLGQAIVQIGLFPTGTFGTAKQSRPEAINPHVRLGASTIPGDITFAINGITGSTSTGGASPGLLNNPGKQKYYFIVKRDTQYYFFTSDDDGQIMRHDNQLTGLGGPSSTKIAFIGFFIQSRFNGDSGNNGGGLAGNTFINIDFFRVSELLLPWPQTGV